MHIPDGLFDVPTSAAAGAVAVAGVAWCVRRAEADLDDRLAPLAGLTAAFVFAVQMLNFPVLPGVSGHLLGGALAATLVGPAAGALCLTVVLLVQMLFADGGVTAIGLNITIMGFTTALAGYALVRGLLRVLPRTTASVPLAAGVAAGLTVPLTAAVFTAVYAVGGTTAVPVATLATAMVGVHLAIGVGEGVITAATVAAVVAVRPDLVHAARGLARPRTVVLPDGPAPEPARPRPAAERADAEQSGGAR